MLILTSKESRLLADLYDLEKMQVEKGEGDKDIRQYNNDGLQEQRLKNLEQREVIVYNTKEERYEFSPLYRELLTIWLEPDVYVEVEEPIENPHGYEMDKSKEFFIKENEILLVSVEDQNVTLRKLTPSELGKEVLLATGIQVKESTEPSTVEIAITSSDFGKLSSWVKRKKFEKFDQYVSDTGVDRDLFLKAISLWKNNTLPLLSIYTPDEGLQIDNILLVWNDTLYLIKTAGSLKGTFREIVKTSTADYISSAIDYEKNTPDRIKKVFGVF
ncbi:hypothetical protein QA612_20725 [Evansella sp. AB-P1]|uniref:hypothetical protein n=1 Tax=Evansella sp. AB-P1 TaxID=3037653 RepID=UPI00241C552C|nr:hypothetical protein [Evansella sp. AB-P1]MDG5789885.1 hypothetical protein [Evansella sp. AB-P1]